MVNAIRSAYRRFMGLEKQDRQRIIGFFSVVAALVIGFAFAVTSQGDDDSPPSTAANNVANGGPEPRQQLYDAFLRQARRDLATTDPDLFCDPDYWELLAGQVDGATGSDRAILQLALGDACREEGYVGGEYSTYH